MMGIGSFRGGCGNIAAWDTSVCGAAADDNCCWDSGSTRTTGLGGGGDIAAGVEAGEPSGGLGEMADGLRGSGSCEESEGGVEGEGGFGTAVAEAGSGFVLMATALATGGGRIGLVCVTVI